MIAALRKLKSRLRPRVILLAGAVVISQGVVLGCSARVPRSTWDQVYDAVTSRAPSSLPRGSVSQGIGIAARNPTADDFDQIAATGVHIVRTDLQWQNTEKVRGQYDFSRYVAMAAQAHQRGLRMIFILDYGNPIYSGMTKTVRAQGLEVAMRPTAPQDDLGMGAYAAWAAAAARALTPYNPIFEVWNEPDTDVFWPPHADPGAYGQLAAIACAAIHQSAPGTAVIGPAAAHAPTSDQQSPPYLAAVADTSAARCFDGYSAHFYKMTGQRSNDVGMFRSMRMIFQTTPDRVVNSEWGKSAFGNVTEDDQATFLSRSMLNAIDASSIVNIWFSWRDQADHPIPNERHFGLLRADGTPKPSLVALHTMMQQVGSYHPRCTMAGEPAYSGLLFTGAGDPMVAIWSDGWSKNWTPPQGWRIGSVIGIDGQPVPFDPSGVRLGPQPVYIHLTGGGDSVPTVLCRDQRD